MTTQQSLPALSRKDEATTTPAPKMVQETARLFPQKPLPWHLQPEDGSKDEVTTTPAPKMVQETARLFPQKPLPWHSQPEDGSKDEVTTTPAPKMVQETERLFPQKPLPWHALPEDVSKDEANTAPAPKKRRKIERIFVFEGHEKLSKYQIYRLHSSMIDFRHRLINPHTRMVIGKVKIELLDEPYLIEGIGIQEVEVGR